MEIDFHININKNTLQGEAKEAATSIKKWIKGLIKNELRGESLRLFFKEVQFFEQNGDNFIKNEVTVRATFLGYKVPRFIKLMLLKKDK